MPINGSVMWLSDKIYSDACGYDYFEQFQFKDLIAVVGDFVLIANVDAGSPNGTKGCDVAQILALYENLDNKRDPYRAKVRWYSRPCDLPAWCLFNSSNTIFYDNEVLPAILSCSFENILFSYSPTNNVIVCLSHKVIEDHRPFDIDVSVETFRAKCHVVKTYTNANPKQLLDKTKSFQFVCRFRLKAVSKRKGHLEPILEEERKTQSVYTPKKRLTLSPLCKFSTPDRLTKEVSKISLSEEKNWSVTKNEGTKLLLKKAILKDHNSKQSPGPLTSNPKIVIDSPKSSKKLTKAGIRNILLELKENSEDELPTLIIRDSENEKKTLHRPSNYLEMELTPRRSNRISKNPVKYDESPTKTPEKVFRKRSRSENSDEEFVPTQTPRTPRTPKVIRTPRTPNSLNPTSCRVTGSTLHKISFCSEIVTTPRRSNRVSTNPVKYLESPTKTPEKVIRKRSHSENCDEEFIPTQSPRTPRTPKIIKTPRTPSSLNPASARVVGSARRKLNTSSLTPTLQKRSHPVKNNGCIKDNYSLPGREKQMDTIMYFIKTRLLEGTSGCLYISGVPGTGKTATVCSALQQLQNEPDLPEFHLIQVNGMKILNPRQAYVEICKQLTGKSVSWKQACILLEKMFTTKANIRKLPTVLLVDELDALCTRKQDVLYDIMEWARHDAAKLTVLAVANAMDLPDTALPARVASRVGLTRLTFQPYTHTELKTIVTTKMTGATNINADALELIARKVAAVSGDARRALELCKRTLAHAAGAAGLRDVARALAEATCSATVGAVKSKAPAEKLILRAVASEVDRTGSEETTLSRVLSAAAAIVALDGRPYRSATSVRAPTSSQALVICQRLAASRLLLMKPRPGDPRIVLNISSDDIHYATKQISVSDV